MRRQSRMYLFTFLCRTEHDALLKRNEAATAAPKTKNRQIQKKWTAALCERVILQRVVVNDESEK